MVSFRRRFSCWQNKRTTPSSRYLSQARCSCSRRVQLRRRLHMTAFGHWIPFRVRWRRLVKGVAIDTGKPSWQSSRARRSSLGDRWRKWSTSRVWTSLRVKYSRFGQLWPWKETFWYWPSMASDSSAGMVARKEVSNGPITVRERDFRRGSN
uniref:(northern house mosquito) hypothetical protein n=1 Tax=Culex pipiens TaxID=7175 RepID=A0A8D8E6K5_CULPI